MANSDYVHSSNSKSALKEFPFYPSISNTPPRAFLPLVAVNICYTKRNIMAPLSVTNKRYVCKHLLKFSKQVVWSLLSSVLLAILEPFYNYMRHLYGASWVFACQIPYTKYICGSLQKNSKNSQSLLLKDRFTGCLRAALWEDPLDALRAQTPIIFWIPSFGVQRMCGSLLLYYGGYLPWYDIKTSAYYTY